MFWQCVVFLGDFFCRYETCRPANSKSAASSTHQGFIEDLQDFTLWRKGIIRMSVIAIVFWSGVIWERARMGLDNITFLWLLPFPLPEYNPSQIWPSPLNCQHHTIFYVTYTNRMEKTKYLAKFLKFFLCEPVYRVIFWLVPPKSFKCSQLKKGKFELKLPIFSVRYLYFHFFSRDFAISNT